MRAPFFALLLSALAAIPASAAEMPKDFVYLSDVDPSIEQDMRYAGADNFTGRPVPGYDAPECVLVRQAAEALKAVQAEVKAKGFKGLKTNCFHLIDGRLSRQMQGYGDQDGHAALNLERQTLEGIVATLAAFREGAGPLMDPYEVYQSLSAALRKFAPAM
jgi:hypothetical protein